MFDRIHCWGLIQRSFGRFIGKIGRYSSVRDFTVHIFNQMNFGRFLSNFIKFSRFFFKIDGIREEANFLVSTDFLNITQSWLGSALYSVQEWAVNISTSFDKRALKINNVSIIK
jgi:hypothetical protein